MHREEPLDFWLTVATVVALFVPIWGLLLAPSRLISVPMYLLVIGIPALLLVTGVLIYGRLRNKVLLNRFLVGYAGGIAGTLVIHVFLLAGVLMGVMPSLVYTLGNVALGRGFTETASTWALVMGLVYHYMLNGAAWGAVYGLLFGKARWWYGMFFGAAIWAVLMVSPVFYSLNFPRVSPATGLAVIAGMLVAHLFYGGVIGYVVYRYAYPEVGVEGSKAVRPSYV